MKKKINFQSISKNCPRVLLSLSLTQCGKLVVLDNETLEKGNIHKDVSRMTYDELKKLNVSAFHPLGYVFSLKCQLMLNI
jgi:hypothetical protein